MKKFMTLFKAVLVLLSAAAVSGFGQTITDVVKETYPMQSGGRLVLENVNGKVVISGWNKDELYMEAEKVVKTRDRERAQELMEQVEIVVEERREEIYIKTILPHQKGGFWNRMAGDNGSASVHYRLNVPHKCILEIENTNGAIEVTEVNGDLTLETTNGKIWLRDAGGMVVANTTNGSVDAELSKIGSDGEMEFTTTNGSVKLYLPRDAGFELDAKTTNGSVNSDFPDAGGDRHSRKRLQGEVNGGGPRIYVRTTNGSVNVREL